MQDVAITKGMDRPPAGATLLYEAEWNEEATADEHRAAVTWFAREAGVEIPPVRDLTDDEAVWLLPA